jgi:hypothetical protein
MIMTNVRAHSTTIALSAPLPPEVAVGDDIVLKIEVSCAGGCDLRGMPVKVTAPGGAVISEPVHLAAGKAILEIGLKAPRRVGEHVWSVVSGPHEFAGIHHGETILLVRIRTNPHLTSLAVWDIPSPVVTGERFAIKVGAKSSAGVTLAGRKIEVRDQAGTTVARGRLGEAPLPGTSALFWADVELFAPAEAGMHWWSVKFEPTELELPHESASTKFSVAIAPPPEHRLTIKVIEKDTATPIENAQVQLSARLGAYRAATDGSGLAEVDMPTGVYDLNIWKVGYEAPAKTVELNANASVQVEVLPVPEENPDSAWLM